MTYIHERAAWPDLAWDDGALADARAAVRQKHGRLLGKMESLGFDLRSEANAVALTSEVVMSSAIEGEALNPDEVRSSVAQRLGLDVAGLPKANRNVEGVVEMLLDATRNAGEPLTKRRLLRWHTSLFTAAAKGKRPKVVGAWRTGVSGPMRVVSGTMGRETIHFEAPVAKRLEAEMVGFIDWFNSSGIDPVLKAGVAHFRFVTIHPFEDGNGRIARAIADMALARADGIEDRFYSMSAQIEAERKDYYRELEAAQRGSVDVTRWMMWFLGCLGRAIDAAELSLASVLSKAKFWQRFHQHPMNARQRLVLNRMLNGFKGLLSTSKYAALAKCSSDTALRDIQELVTLGALVRNPGSGRNTSYRLADAR